MLAHARHGRALTLGTGRRSPSARPKRGIAAGNLYGLTANFFGGTDLHSLVRIDTKTAATKLLKVLDAHGGTSDGVELGAIAYNPADGSFYYADRDANQTS